ncbi:MAG: nitrous oxide reductase accessory protein NosL [Kiloniellales bacterium]
MRLRQATLALVLAATLAACGEEQEVAERPAPLEPGREAIGHYCGMMVVEHAGPKGQIFLKGEAEPVWFTSVRDTLAFTMLPEEPKDIAAIYVNDMAKAQSWDQPEPGMWVEARGAVFVVGSDARGGMGAPEAVPFSDMQAAERFKAEHGGLIHAFGHIPGDFILGPGDAQDAAQPGAGQGDGHGQGGSGSHSND